MNQLLRRKKGELAKNKKKGFTLVELVIVIAIIAILAAMAIPKLSSMRTNAKVSNDVAAAKNIATIASTMLANGTIDDSTADIDVSDDAGKDIREQLDGKVAADGKSEASGVAFMVEIGDDESIRVTVDSNELYPDNDGEGRKAYAKVDAEEDEEEEESGE